MADILLEKLVYLDSQKEFFDNIACDCDFFKFLLMFATTPLPKFMKSLCKISYNVGLWDGFFTSIFFIKFMASIGTPRLLDGNI